MRRIGWFLVFLVGVGWLASQVRLTDPYAASGGEPHCWRRTRDGWEQATWLAPETATGDPALHPSVVGLLQLLLSVSALIVFPGRIGARPADDRRSPG